MNKVMTFALTLTISAALLACNDDSKSASSPAATSEPVSYAASPSLGQILNAPVTIFAADGITVLASGNTGSSGVVSIPVSDYEGAYIVLVEGADGATYFDESMATFIDFSTGQIRALASTPGDVAVTPLTELAYQIAVNQSALPIDAAKVSQFNEMVRVVLAPSISDILLPPTLLGDSTVTFLENNDAGRYALILAALAQLADDDVNGRPALAITTALTADLGDGVIDGQAGGAAIDVPYTDFLADMQAALNIAASDYSFDGSAQDSAPTTTVVIPAEPDSTDEDDGSAGGDDGSTGGDDGSAGGDDGSTGGDDGSTGGDDGSTGGDGGSTGGDDGSTGGDDGSAGGDDGSAGGDDGSTGGDDGSTGGDDGSTGGDDGSTGGDDGSADGDDGSTGGDDGSAGGDDGSTGGDDGSAGGDDGSTGGDDGSTGGDDGSTGGDDGSTGGDDGSTGGDDGSTGGDDGSTGGDDGSTGGDDGSTGGDDGSTGGDDGSAGGDDGSAGGDDGSTGGDDGSTGGDDGSAGGDDGSTGGDDGSAGGDDGSTGGDDGGVSGGSALACSEFPRLTAGTTYEFVFDSTDSSGADLRTTSTTEVIGVKTFKGSQATEARSEVQARSQSNPEINSDSITFSYTGSADNNTTLLTYGVVTEASVQGFTTRVTVANDPAFELRYDLAPGQSYSQSYTTSTETSVVGFPSPGGGATANPRDVTVTYLGREQVTVPAGTFDTCKFTTAEGNGVSTQWIGVGNGIPVKSTGDGDESVLVSASVNGDAISGL